MRITSRGFGIHYTVGGEGAPLMLVAGTLLAARHWDELGYVAALTRRWRVINVDPLGHGLSDTPHEAGAYQAAGVAADLIAVLDAEDLGRAVIWGYSRGGWQACSAASRHPDRVERIVVGGYAMHAHRVEAGRLLAPLAGHLRAGDWAGAWRILGVTDRAFTLAIEQGNDARAVAAAIEGSLRPTRFVDPASITCPASYYAGGDDWILPHVHTDVDALGATLDVIAGQTHFGAYLAAVAPVLEVVTRRLVGPPL